MRKSLFEICIRRYIDSTSIKPLFIAFESCWRMSGFRDRAGLLDESGLERTRWLPRVVRNRENGNGVNIARKFCVVIRTVSLVFSFTHFLTGYSVVFQRGYSSC